MTDLEKALQAGGQEITNAPVSAEPAPAPADKEPSTIERIGAGFKRMDAAKDSFLKRVYSPSSYEAGKQKYERNEGELAQDPTAQAVVLATTLGPLGRAAYSMMSPYVGAVPAGGLVGAGEGALGAKSAGAPVGPAALLGGLLGSVGAATSRVPNEAAVTRNNAQITKDINKGATKAPAKLASDVRFRGDSTGDVLSELPETRKTVATKARTNPADAGKEVKNTVRDLTSENDAVFDAIQAQHGGVPVEGMAQRLTTLEGTFTQQGRGVAADAVARFRDDIVKRYGKDPGSKLTAEQLRNIRNDVGDIAFPGGGKPPKGARRATASIYDEFNGAIEDVAGVTAGVDVPAFIARNRQISTLLPVQKALLSRASSAADRELSLYKRAREGIGNAATSLSRRARYGAETGGGDNTALMAAPASYLLNGGRQ